MTVDTESLGGGPLARAILEGRTPPGWVIPAPRGAGAWRERASAVRARVRGAAWVQALEPALAPTDRLRAAAAHGVVITTGQQPGLFGGPLYTLYKALTALELADAIEAACGIPAAPVFWAATDDGDLVEGSATWVARRGGLDSFRLTLSGPTLADAPLGEAVAGELTRYVAALGSAPHLALIDALRASYTPTATAGGAYVSLLRGVLGPLGISVLDASHPAVRTAAAPILRSALDRATQIAAALRGRAEAIESAGFAPQVADVAKLSLVFSYEHGQKLRVPIGGAPTGALSPNVLLRPIVESVVLPTIGYVAGPGELAYFAQVTAVADALGVAPPLGVPRWSGTVIERHIATLLERRQVTLDDLRADPHGPETRYAWTAMPEPLRASIEALRESVGRCMDAIQVSTDGLEVPPASVDGTRGSIAHRIDRLERRVRAAVKRRDDAVMAEFATLRAALYPLGERQERVLNFVSMLTREGSALIDEVRAKARVHGDALVHGG
ncbi:MAG TPA: bacillithiol biosynthesis BshC [Gemmatimonadaceae bacterium]|nr:bacillithiol biosynthesis BshC [Gemmatimonadaceae bacterium]